MKRNAGEPVLETKNLGVRDLLKQRAEWQTARPPNDLQRGQNPGHLLNDRWMSGPVEPPVINRPERPQ
jgi:hypothetical protein